jgi:hypothetical protein
MSAGRSGSMRGITAVKRSVQARDRLIAELLEALAQVRTLSGLLPICAAYENVRDDQGYLNQNVTYIRKHSRTEFSRSICSECARR